MLGHIYKKIHSFSQEQNHSENSIGGWLYLVAIGLGYTLTVELKAIYTTIAILFNGTMRVASSLPWARLSICFETGTQILIALWVMYLIILMNNKDKRFPQYYIFLYVGLLAFSVLEMVIIKVLPYPNSFMHSVFNERLVVLYKQAALIIVAGMVLGTYVKISKRAKETFAQ